jgi:hypothetical protein
MYFKAKERINNETQIFHHAKINVIFKKILYVEETKNPSRYYNSITNHKFQHQPKKIYHHLSKILI